MSFETDRDMSLTVETYPCELVCPIIDKDKIASQTGNQMAQEDLQRHLELSKKCAGAVIDDYTKQAKCQFIG
jgi:hypothetical protein